jgi:hypothetical protein
MEVPTLNLVKHSSVTFQLYFVILNFVIKLNQLDYIRVVLE